MLSLETSRQSVMVDRNPGCQAIFKDDGLERQTPVCMGGLAIEGCNRPAICEVEFRSKADASVFVHIIANDGERVTDAVSVFRSS